VGIVIIGAVDLIVIGTLVTGFALSSVVRFSRMGRAVLAGMALCRRRIGGLRLRACCNA
jgi:hypothetical protein